MTDLLPPPTSKSPALLASQASGIIIGLKVRLKGKPNLMAFGILNSIENKMPAVKLIQEIKEMIRDNEPSMRKLFGGGVLGEDLLNRIKDF